MKAHQEGESRDAFGRPFAAIASLAMALALSIECSSRRPAVWLRIRCCCAVSALALVAGIASPELATASVGGPIVYAHVGVSTSGVSEVWAADADGTNRRKLTEGRAPVLAADGETVAFLTGGYPNDHNKIKLIQIDGSNERTLCDFTPDTTFVGRPDFSYPTGGAMPFLVFSFAEWTGAAGESVGVYKTPISSCSLQPAVDFSRTNEWASAISPSGDLAFTSWDCGDCTPRFEDWHWCPADPYPSDGTGNGLYIKRGDLTYLLVSPEDFGDPLCWPPEDADNRRYIIDPAFSPDGSKVAFAVERQDCLTPICSPTWELYTADVVTGELRRLTTNGTDTPPGSAESIDDYNPAWLPDATGIAYFQQDWRQPPFNVGSGIYLMPPDGSDTAPLITPDAPVQEPCVSGLTDAMPCLTSPSFTKTSLADLTLARRYAPVLAYSLFESYNAASIRTMTDWSGNHLDNSSGSAIASQPATGFLPELSIDFLGASYPGGQTATDADRLAETQDSGRDPLIAATTMQQSPLYRDRAYARTIVDSTGKTWIQYWLWYYYNPLDFFGSGEHQGDWELIQVGLDALGYPTDVVYSQHGGGERCTWTSVPKTADGRPIAYVAIGSHANYLSPGRHVLRSAGPVPLASDYADGAGYATLPQVDSMTGPTSGWVTWPGRWGTSDGTPLGTESPRGPAFQSNGSWNPATFASDAADCSVEGAASTPGVQSSLPDGPADGNSVVPPMPSQVSAVRLEEEARISYTLAESPPGVAQSKYVVLSVDPAAANDNPTTVVRATEGLQGTAVLPIPKGDGPYTVRMTSVSGEGVLSRIREAPLDG